MSWDNKFSEAIEDYDKLKELYTSMDEYTNRLKQNNIADLTHLSAMLARLNIIKIILDKWRK